MVTGSGSLQTNNTYLYVVEPLEDSGLRCLAKGNIVNSFAEKCRWICRQASKKSEIWKNERTRSHRSRPSWLNCSTKMCAENSRRLWWVRLMKNMAIQWSGESKEGGWKHLSRWNRWKWEYICTCSCTNLNTEHVRWKPRRIKKPGRSRREKGVMGGVHRTCCFFHFLSPRHRICFRIHDISVGLKRSRIWTRSLDRLKGVR